MKTITICGIKAISLVFTFIGLLFISYYSLADEINVNPDNKNHLQVIENTYQKLSLENILARIKAIPVDTEKGTFTRLHIQGYSKSEQYGHPELPVERKLIEIPVGAEPVIKIISAEYQEIDLNALNFTHLLYPAQPPRSKSEDHHEFIFDEEAYKINSYGNKILVTVDILGFLRSSRIARLDISPVQYNPVTHTIKVFERIEFEIIFKNANIDQTIALKQRLASPCFESINRQLFNYKPLSNRENFMRYPVKYVIISDRMFESQVQPLIDWKIIKGFTVVEAYTDQPNVGSSTYSIKSFIDSLYTAGTPEDPAPSFVLFAGDVEQIPAWDNGNGATDRNYCEFTGDIFPDIYYGRYSAQTTTHLQPQVDKTILYEMYTMPDPSYLDEVVMIAGMDASHGHAWANGQINYGTINYFNEDHGILSHTYLYPESGSMSAQIIQNISDGVTYGNYTAHCSPNGWADPSFTIANIPSLQNQDMYGLLVGNCCSSSEYQLNECFGEALLRAENKGAVGYIGASNSTYWDEDYYWAVGVGEISEIPPPYEETTLGMYDRAFHDHGEPFEDWYVSQDEMVFAGNLAVSEGSPGSANYYWDVYNILGDPSLMIYFSEPPVISVTYPELLPLGSTSFTVTTEPYAYAAISMDGVLHGAAIADVDGIAEILFDPLNNPGIADVIVTKQNGEPFFGTVVVASPAGPYMVLNDFNINDTSGNNNGQADYGETISLDVELDNLGNGDALNTHATISTSDTLVILTDDYQEWGTIPGLTPAWQNDAYAFVVEELIPDQHIVTFEMIIEADGKESWNQIFDITLNAPVLDIVSITIDDSQFGNDNGRLDPGETADIKIKNENDGHCESETAIATIVSYNAYLTFDNTVDTIGSLGLLGYKYATFRVHVDPETPIGVIIVDLDYAITAGPYEATRLFKQKIGLLYDDFETGDFTKFDWVQAGNMPWTITHIFPYEGLYSAKSGDITDMQTSVLSLTLEIMTADSISFIRKVSSQENSDKLKFYIDNSLQEAWSGTTVGWKKEIFAVNTGWHTFKWIYQKDSQGSAGQDCAWLDFVIMPPIMTLTCYAGPNDVCCEVDVFQCSGEATDWETVEWSTSGTGTFDDNIILEPIYFPSTDDILAGYVVLSLLATDNDGLTVDDEMTLTFITEPETPEIPSGPDYVDVRITPFSDYTTSSVPYTETYEWMIEPAEAGDISGDGLTGTVQWSDTYWGTAVISVKAINQCGESDYSEGFNVTVDNTVSIAEIPNDLSISVFPNPNDGQFKIDLHSSCFHIISIKVVNPMGLQVFHKEGIRFTGKYSDQLNLKHLSNGLYFLIFEGENIYMANKLIISK